MIVRQFLHWIRNAPASTRAEATSALTRAYLFSDLSADDLAAAEGAMLMLLDDPSPLVRLALAEGLADSPHAPPAVVHALANDQPEIAAIILEHSVLFIDADLVEIVATGDASAQAAIARRVHLPRAIAAAIAEVGSAEACLILIENPEADVAQFSIDRIAERFGTLAAIRESLLGRADLPASTRQALVSKLSEARALIRHLCATGQLTVGLVLRALLSGNSVMFEEALAELSDLPLSRIHGIVHDRSTSSFRALYDKAGLPASTYPAFREAIAALREANYAGELGGSSRLKRRMIERVLNGCERAEIGEIEPLLMLLRRFATEAAREEARLFCDDLIAQDEAENFALAQEQAEQQAAAIDALPDAVAQMLALEDISAYGDSVPLQPDIGQDNGAYHDDNNAYAAEDAQPEPGPTDAWPQVHFAPHERPRFDATDRAYSAAYGQLDDGYAYAEPAPERLDPLIEFYYQHLGPEAEPAFDHGHDPLLDYRPAQERGPSAYARSGHAPLDQFPRYVPGMVRRHDRAAA